MSMEILLIILLRTSVHGLVSNREGELCTISNNSMECDCKNQSDIVMNAIILPTISHIIIKECGNVIIPLNAMSFADLERLEFSNIGLLHISPFAFSAISGINSLIINNTKLQLYHSSFAGIKNTDILALINVTTEIIPSGAFEYVEDVQLFKISYCNFQRIEKQAFILKNITNFEITDSEINLIESESFFIDGGEKVVLSSSLVQIIKNESFSVQSIHKLIIFNCKFNDFDKFTMSGNNINLINISHTNITYLRSNAFLGVVTSDFLVFEHNMVELAEIGSLELIFSPDFPRHLNVSYCCNTFTCNCSMSWLWGIIQDEYNPFLAHSTCLNDETKQLSYFIPIYDSNHSCTSLEPQSTYDIYDLENGQSLISPAKSVEYNLKYFVVIILATFMFYKLES